jgi:hypothetical protein
MEARAHWGELKVAADLPEAPVLMEEMRDFQRKISDAGRSSWNAKAGKHDDLINSIAINLWMCTALPTFTTGPLPF